MKKSTIYILIAIVVVALLYFYFEGNPLPSSSSSSLETQQAGVGDLGAQVLVLLNQIQSLKIDGTIFKDPAYQTLRDYSVPIPQQAVGRENPFAPIPGVATPGH